MILRHQLELRFLAVAFLWNKKAAAPRSYYCDFECDLSGPLSKSFSFFTILVLNVIYTVNRTWFSLISQNQRAAVKI